MTIFDEIIAASTEVEALNNYIDNNFQKIYDYFTWGRDEDLNIDLHKIQDYITSRRILILSLPTNEYNLSFLTLLLEIAERLSLSSQFSYLFNFLKKQNHIIPQRLHASAKYLVGIKTDKAYLDCYDAMYQELKKSLDEEEDDANKVLITIVNYYLKAIQDFGKFNIAVAQHIKEKLEHSIAEDENSFLNRPLIWDITKTSLDSYKAAAIHIRQLLDEFLNRGIPEIDRIEGFLIESDSSYSKSIKEIPTNFTSLRDHCKELYKTCDNDKIYQSLQHGVSILTEECQLYGYFYSFGQMHYYKMIEASQFLPNELFEKKVNLVDWGCGQGLGTIVLIEQVQNRGIKISNYQSFLIEPSKLALKRASLHVTKYSPGFQIITINKVLDSLTTHDFKEIKGGHFVHIFSNVLDMNLFSLTALIELIKERFKGCNYFVIVSPFRDSIIRSKIDSFVDAFSGLSEFEIISKIDSRAHQWKYHWTRIQRVFKVVI